MAAERVLAADTDGTLSVGTGTNYAFTTFLTNEVAYVDITPPTGRLHESFVLHALEVVDGETTLDTDAIAFSLSETFTGEEPRGSIDLGFFTDTIRVYMRIMRIHGYLGLVADYDGFIDRPAPISAECLNLMSLFSDLTVANPTDPSGLTLTPGDTEVLVEWTAGDMCDSYKVQYADNENFSGATTVASADLSELIGSLVNASPYYFRVCGVVNDIDGPWTAAETATPQGSEINIVTGAVVDFRAGRANSTNDGPHTNSDGDKTTWFDIQNNYDGTLADFAFGSGSGWGGSGTAQDPYYLEADGSNDYMSLGSLPTPSIATGMTIEVWMCMPNGYTQDLPGIVDRCWGSPAYQGFSLDFGADGDGERGKPRMVLAQSQSTTKKAVWGTSLFDGQWHHIVATAKINDGITLRVDNGTPVTQTLTGYQDNGSTHAMQVFGGLPTTNYAQGKIAQLRIYPKVLSAAEIENNYNAGPNALT